MQFHSDSAINQPLVHGCWTKSKQNPLLSISFGASIESVWKAKRNGRTLPEIVGINHLFDFATVYKECWCQTYSKRFFPLNSLQRWKFHRKCDLHMRLIEVSDQQHVHSQSVASRLCTNLVNPANHRRPYCLPKHYYYRIWWMPGNDSNLN